ncbi:glycerol dehydrogenase [Clostridium pasteurianum DSM 525 = ATCC 6013]|uniref:Glycerol dehydrogenase n=1 Tax=Clostridium pasteurianum DSM 525 = ATCC 6013 TaxID=1262449 RepID=A0A0H3J9P4_CLOPA|nr:iron-containing alcohol dehydrogenase family protein [Clostridium pasteurianum]AJA48873.1 glycerol dehydrogenase [Clostridium pasteurianum DSM 525 = ATCC 6013]AJA52861.1 glycerol dehydrogenase [Clostridium pasteurianum DSM 525 = ATCC 6013]AOZ76084.1 glycerol dehydrogenase [Clostridium pasteurianum DSM 525 = ATCC 6013]AOZ79880.1 glycerol dehydrogenase [Clostridium pasteurianum]ELP60169.1 glycerol dehydrogenase [Clostridium pasteurianum DSM 525 = ATCC 6013]
MSYSVFLPSYSIGTDAYDRIKELCPNYGKNIVVIGGKTAIEKVKKKIKSAVTDSTLEILDFIWYGGDSSFENVEMLKENPLIHKADIIFAVGGGRAIDTCKVLSHQINKPIFTFPTIASNCAACTSVCVMYDNKGVFKELYFRDKPAEHTFICTEIIAEAPKVFLWAGIGDALSKKYECTFSSRNDKLEHFNALGVQISKICTEPLLENGKKALEDCEANIASYELEQVTLDIIISTGLVSNLVINDYNSCLAHSIYYGMTELKQIEKNHLHGEVVSYGVLVLLLCDKQFDELNKVYNFCKSIGLPTKLSDLEVTKDELKIVISKVMQTGDIVHVPYEITYDMIEDSILKLEEYSNEPVKAV